jgi:hypothetical protein
LRSNTADKDGKKSEIFHSPGKIGVKNKILGSETVNNAAKVNKNGTNKTIFR